MSATRRVKLANTAEAVFKDDVPNHWAKAQANIERCIPISQARSLQSLEDLRELPAQTQPLPPASKKGLVVAGASHFWLVRKSMFCCGLV